MAAQAPKEIKALARIIDELDYYQILDVPREAQAPAIKLAYHATARKFHPDANRRLAAELQAAVSRIAKRVTEAYSVLRDPRRRKVYDEQLGADENDTRMRMAEAEAKVEKRATEELRGRTPNGRRYFALAQSDIARHDYAAATHNLQTALAFEGDNELFKQKLKEVRQLHR